MRINFAFVWKKSSEKYYNGWIEKSNQLYNELLEKEIIPEIKRENKEELTLEKLTQMVRKVDDVVCEWGQKIDETTDVQERNVLRNGWGFPK